LRPNTLIRAILTGRLAPLGRRGVASGIFKTPRDEAVEITRTGLAGDEQGDRRHHGGPEKAVHHYPFDHYDRWLAEQPALREPLAREGAFGENVSTLGLAEADVCIGDVFRLGTSLVQVSQGRQPCWRLNERFGLPSMARQVQQSLRTGWYYRVLEPGRVSAGDLLDLVDRPLEGWTIERVLNVLYRDTLNVGELRELEAMDLLAESWRQLARRRLRQRQVEDWARRLDTPD